METFIKNIICIQLIHYFTHITKYDDIIQNNQFQKPVGSQS